MCGACESGVCGACGYVVCKRVSVTGVKCGRIVWIVGYDTLHW